MENRTLLSGTASDDIHALAHVDVPFGVFTADEIAAFENVAVDSSLSSKTSPAVAAYGIHASDVLTFVLDFKETTQGSTFDIFGNEVSTFDVTSYGFAASAFDTVANAILAEVEEDYFDELIGTVAGPAGQDLEIDFLIGDIGTAPVGVSEYYYVQVGTGVAGPHSGEILGVAGDSVVRNASGGGPKFGIASGDVVASVFTDAIVTLNGLRPSNALTAGNLGFTTNAIAGTVSHEVGHTLSLSHVKKSGSVQPTSGASPIMGTGAIDLPNNDRIGDREFSLSGVDSENGNASRQHMQQLADAVGLHSFTVPNVTLSADSPNIMEGAGLATFTATLSTATSRDVTVDLGFTGTATLNDDFTRSGPQIVITAGNSSGTVTVTALPDMLLEANETIIVDITSVTNANESGIQQATTTISGESATADLSVTTQGSEVGPVHIVYTVSLSQINDTGASITFDLDDSGSGSATADDDYATIAANARISVATGANTGTLTVPVIDDSLVEASETVIARISNSSNAAVTVGTATAVASITDNDTPTIPEILLNEILIDPDRSGWDDRRS